MEGRCYDERVISCVDACIFQIHVVVEGPLAILSLQDDNTVFGDKANICLRIIYKIKYNYQR